MSANRKPTADPSVYSPLDRAAVPDAVENDSESVWAKFEALQRGEEVEATQQVPLLPAAPAAGYDTTQPLEPGPRAGDTGQAPLQAAPAAAPQRLPSLGEVMVVARRRNRACPKPEAWAAFHALLPTRELHGRLLGAPLPITGPAWANSTPMERRLRLRDQIEWAERTGALAAVFAFLSALPEEEWVHFSD